MIRKWSSLNLILNKHSTIKILKKNFKIFFLKKFILLKKIHFKITRFKRIKFFKIKFKYNFYFILFCFKFWIIDFFQKKNSFKNLFFLNVQIYNLFNYFKKNQTNFFNNLNSISNTFIYNKYNLLKIKNFDLSNLLVLNFINFLINFLVEYYKILILFYKFIINVKYFCF